MPLSPQLPKINASEVFNETFVSIIRPLNYLITFFTIISTFLVLLIIFTQTPKEMKSFKKFLISYLFHGLCFQFTFALFSPIIFHPQFIIYPMGLANIFPPMISFLIISMTIFHCMSFLDSTVAMSIQQYYSIQTVGKLVSKRPLIVYVFLTGISFCGLIVAGVIILFKPLFSLFFVSPENALANLNKNFVGLETKIKVVSTIILADSETNNNNNLIPFLIVAIGLCAFLRIFIALIYLCFNIQVFLALRPELPIQHYLKNRMLLRLTYIQLIGFLVFIGIPLLIILGIFLFNNKNPCFFINFCLIPINFFALFNNFVTIVVVQPYHEVILRLFKRCFGLSQVNAYVVDY